MRKRQCGNFIKQQKIFTRKKLYKNLCTECKIAIKDNIVYKVNKICKPSDTRAFYNFIN